MAPRTRGDQALHALAASQDGLLSRAQALGELSPAQVSSRLARHWQRMHSRVYLSGSAEPTSRQRLRAGLLQAGPAAVLGGPTACRQHGLLEVPDDGRVHLLLPHRTRLHGDPGLVLLRSHRPAGAVVLEQLPAVALARAVADACRGMTELQAVRALACEAVQRGLVDLGALDGELQLGPRAGSGLLRRAVADLRAGVRSAPEAEVRDGLEACPLLPPAEYNAQVHDLRGRWVACVDVLFRAVRLVLEITSRRWHAESSRFDATMDRQARLAAAGYTVLPVTPGAWRAQQRACLDQVVSAYRRLDRSERA